MTNVGLKEVGKTFARKFIALSFQVTNFNLTDTPFKVLLFGFYHTGITVSTLSEQKG